METDREEASEVDAEFETDAVGWSRTIHENLRNWPHCTMNVVNLDGESWSRSKHDGRSTLSQNRIATNEQKWCRTQHDGRRQFVQNLTDGVRLVQNEARRVKKNAAVRRATDGATFVQSGTRHMDKSSRDRMNIT